MKGMDGFTTDTVDGLFASPDGNRSGGPHPRRYISPLSATGDYIVTAYLVSICFLSILGNSSVIATYIFKIRKVKPLDLLTINLAVADLLLAFTVFPLSITSSLNHGWAHGHTGCQWYGFGGFFFGVASIMTISAIAAMRFVKLFCVQREDKVLFQYVWKLLFFVWMYSFVIAILPILGVSSYDTEPYNISCTIKWTGKLLEDKIFIFFSVIFALGIPLTVCAVCYTSIFRLFLSRNVGQRRVMERRLVKASFAVMFGFMLAWVPYAVVCSWRAIRSDLNMPIWATVIPVLCAKSSALISPVAYMAFNRQFREEAITLFCCCGCRCCGLSVNDDFTGWDKAVGGLLGRKRIYVKCSCNGQSENDSVGNGRAYMRRVTRQSANETQERLNTDHDLNHSRVYIGTPSVLSRSCSEYLPGVVPSSAPSSEEYHRSAPFLSVTPSPSLCRLPSSIAASEEEESSYGNDVKQEVIGPVEVIVHAPFVSGDEDKSSHSQDSGGGSLQP